MRIRIVDGGCLDGEGVAARWGCTMTTTDGVRRRNVPCTSIESTESTESIGSIERKSPHPNIADAPYEVEVVYW